MKCESCTDAIRLPAFKARQAAKPGHSPEASGRKLVEDSRRRDVVARLRERYDEARGHVSPEGPYVNLDWILGARRNRALDDAAFDAGTTRLVILWLQDLALELDSRAPGSPGSTAFERAIRPEPPGLAVAQTLRVATREFALAFRSHVEMGQGT